MTKFRLLLSVCVIVLMSSCSKKLTYLTQNMYNDFNWSEQELKKIQFYVSQDIVLYRSSKEGQSTIENGKIRLKNDRKVEEVIINKGTPGILIFSPKQDRFAVCFDKDPNKYLMFGPNKKAKGRYVLMAKDWKRSEGTITYGNEEYYTDSSSAYASLMVDIKRAQRSIVKTNTASGRKVN